MNTYLNYIHVHWNLFRSHDSTFVLENFTRSAISDIYIYMLVFYGLVILFAKVGFF